MSNMVCSNILNAYRASGVSLDRTWMLNMDTLLNMHDGCLL